LVCFLVLAFYVTHNSVESLLRHEASDASLNRCKTIAGAPFGPITPNGNFAGDAMVTNLTHALNGLLTNPFGNGWYDRYGFENADKCSGTFGQTYTTANGARANIRLGSRDFLIEQNWVNNRKGFCAMHP
jgi:hypothetical protein